jgi:3-oxoacyl-[acyl-carrier protein] reductase
MGTLSGKNAFVTGTSQGIGAAISKALVEAGCNICMHYFHSAEIPHELQKFSQTKHQTAICLRADLTNEKEVKSCIKECAEKLGSIDILVNNSGGLVQRRYLIDIDNDFWQTVFDINLKTTMMVTREAFPFLNKTDGASIINIASLAGRAGGHPGSVAYASAKGAMITWSRALARELASHGVRVNVIAPGFIEGTAFHETHTTRDAAINIIKSIPLGRAGRPEDVARAVVFLASEYDGFITGETLDINGGVYCA